MFDQIGLTNDQQPDHHNEISGVKNDMNKPESEKPNNRKIHDQTEEHRQQKKSKYTAVLGDSLLRGIRWVKSHDLLSNESRLAAFWEQPSKR